jgi:hypothetical protein
MPYLTDDEKNDINSWRIGPAFLTDHQKKPGYLPYAFYRMALNFLGHDRNFSRIAAVMGSFVCAMLELYRKAVAPYEDSKIKSNGDVL